MNWIDAGRQHLHQQTLRQMLLLILTSKPDNVQIDVNKTIRKRTDRREHDDEEMGVMTR